MALADDLERIAAAARARHGGLSGIVVTELLDGTRVYLCGYESGAWLALADDAQPVSSRRAVHAAAALSGLCEVAEDALRSFGAPELETAIAPPPRLASSAYLDALGAAARRAELAAGIPGASPFGAALEQAFAAVEALAAQVVARHATPLA